MKKKIILIVVIGSLGWYLGSPLFIDTVVEEEFVQVKTTELVVLASGTFSDADASHKGSGTATVYAQEDGSYLLRLTDFSVTNGPSLSVFLTKQGGDMISIGKLKGNIGNQNYPIPDAIDVNDYDGVLIYCVPFKVPFARAILSPS